VQRLMQLTSNLQEPHNNGKSLTTSGPGLKLTCLTFPIPVDFTVPAQGL